MERNVSKILESLIQVDLVVVMFANPLESGSWLPGDKSPSPKQRAAHSACNIQNNVFIYGGYDGKKKISDVHMLNTGFLFFMILFFRNHGMEFTCCQWTHSSWSFLPFLLCSRRQNVHFWRIRWSHKIKRVICLGTR
jgi:hypothetical protein